MYREELDHSDAESALGQPTLLDGYEYHPTTMELFDYDADRCEERSVEDPAEFRSLVDADSVTWLNVMGLEDVKTLVAIRDLFGIHPLILEDLLRPFQRPKVERYDDHLFTVLQLIDARHPSEVEQIGFVLGEHYLLTFQETPGDVFDGVRRRIREGRPRIREAGPDYLTYELLDAVVDEYFPVLDNLADELEPLEDSLLSEDGEGAELGEVNQQLHEHRKDLLVLRRSAWAQREMLGKLQQEGDRFITDRTRVYLRDAYDHSIRILDIIEAYREMASALYQLQMTAVSNRMNEIMKTLTIIATIFIPLTFVAGIYGMNFDPQVSPWNMPELHAYYGYPITMGVMGLVVVAMLMYFRRENWI